MPPKKRQRTGETLVEKIDYSKLAAEMLRLQRTQQLPTPTETAQCDDIDQATNLTLPNMGQSVLDIHVPSTCNTNTNTLDASVPEITFNNMVDAIFTGELPATGNNVNSNLTHPEIKVSDGIPLGATVSQKIKDKIWSDQYIDLSSLLSSNVEDPYSIYVSSKKLSIFNNARSPKTLSIEQWSTAFLVFCDIYIEKHPEEARPLLKYAHNIREMFDLYGDEPWRVYDEKFRRLKETVKLPWGKLVDELYTKSANSSNCRSTFRPQGQQKPFHQGQHKMYQTNPNTNHSHTISGSHSFRKQSSGNKTKCCIFFNRGQQCAKPCPYQHACFHCKGAHARFQCAEYMYLPKSVQSVTSHVQKPTQNQKSTNPNKS